MPARDSFARVRPRPDIGTLGRLRTAAYAREQARRAARPLTVGQVITRALLVLVAVPVLVRVAVILFALASL